MPQWTHLYIYRCQSCRLMASAPVPHASGSRYRCSICRSWLRYLYKEPITTEEQRELANQGLVFRRWDQPEKPRCGVCQAVLSRYSAALPDGTPCCFRCTPAERERLAQRRAEQPQLDKEQVIALEGAEK
jgi:hypothetical protein